MTVHNHVDHALPFMLHDGTLRGRLVRLSATTEEILTRHAYPPIVGKLVAEAAALASALALSVKFKGIFTFQARGNGPVSLLVADVTSDGAVRAYARFDDEAIAVLPFKPTEPANVQRLLGAGHLTFTVDFDDHRYQGIVYLTGATLAECAQGYFRQSEQLETALSVAALPHPTLPDQWQAAVLMVQRMPFDITLGFNEDEIDELWRTAVILQGSLTSAELLDSSLAPENVLYRLFHAENLALSPTRDLYFGCRCSLERVKRALLGIPNVDLLEMRLDDGSIDATCEFCSTVYTLSPADVAAMVTKKT